MAQNITKMAQDITKMALHDPKCHFMTPNGPKTLPMGILLDIVSCWATLGSFQKPTGAPLASEKGPGWSNMTYNHAIWPYGKCFKVIWGPLINWGMYV